MLASPGVDLRREDVSSVTHVSSLGFFNADGVPYPKKRKKKKSRHIHIRRIQQPNTNTKPRHTTSPPKLFFFLSFS